MTMATAITAGSRRAVNMKEPNDNTPGRRPQRPPIRLSIDQATGTAFGVMTEGSEDLFRSLVVDYKSIKQVRVSHVLPVNPVLRIIFRYLRDKFGEKGLIAKFTRIWPVSWNADMSPTGQAIVLGPFRRRRQAIEAEIAWLKANLRLDMVK
jgi:hypothetical protein